MDHRITADATTLMYQAPTAVSVYYSEAKKLIQDDLMYGKLLPEHLKLAIDLAAMMERDFAAAMQVIASQNILDGLSQIASAISGLETRNET